MKAVIMAGGQGTRLRPLTCTKPKPMVNVYNRPVMEHIINLLKKNGIYDVAVTLQYLPESIKEYFGDGSRFGIRMEYFTEDKPLGTAGSVKNAEEYLSDTFLVVSGDALTDINLAEAIRFHLNKGSLATLVLTRVDAPLEYGVVITDKNGRVNRFIEKPNWSEVFSDTVNTGIYILDKEVLNNFNKDVKFDFSRDLFPKILGDNKPMYGYVADGYWCDIGDLFAYQQCNYDILSRNVNIENYYREIDKDVWCGTNVYIGNNVLINGPVLIGDNVKIKNNTKIEKHSIIGDNCVIGSGCSIKRSILWKNCTIGDNSHLRGCTLCDWVNIKKNTEIYEHSVIGEGTKISENCKINNDIKIWPSKLISEKTVVNTNLIWGSKFTKKIFGDKGITGEVNIDINSEFASRLGASFGVFIGKNPRILISSDGENASEMLKNSFISGLQSSGTEVFDFNTHLLPFSRTAIPFYKLDGGIHICTVSEEGDSKLFIDFLDKKGLNIDRLAERKLENIFAREDYKRCEAEDIKPVKKVYEYKDYYLRSIMNRIKNRVIDYRILVSTPSEKINNIVKPVFEELGIKADYSKLRINRNSLGFTYNLEEEIEYLTEKVLKFGYSLGVIYDKKGENVIIIDEKGNTLTSDTYDMLKIFLISRYKNINSFVVPNTASQAVENYANGLNINVIRTKVNESDVMKKMVEENNDITQNIQFLLTYDTTASIIYILDFLKSENLTLSEVLLKFPKVHIRRHEVMCPWDKKGRVMRTLIEEGESKEDNTNEGIKILRKNGWVLILPDADKAVCKIIAEGDTEEYAKELTGFYEQKIKDIIKE